MENSTVDNCIPSNGCQCHACQGIHCLIPHPGHDHRSPGKVLGVETEEERLTRENLEMIEEALRMNF